MKKEYVCECGKKFYNPNGFNGHKAHCKVHYDAIGKEYNDYGAVQKAKKIHQDNQNKLQQWVSEKHTCETCGKVMTEKFGSGRFCSRSCANTRIHNALYRIPLSLST